MENTERSGFLKLARRSFAVVVAIMGGFIHNESDAFSHSVNADDGYKNLSYETFQKRILKSKLVLKINPRNASTYNLAQHASHSSHSSHASHYSSSQSSHYSSSSTYVPPAQLDTSSSSSSRVPEHVPSKKTGSPFSDTSTTKILQHNLGSRSLSKGSEGMDVQELQQMLLKLGYDVIVTGYYGDKTEQAIMKFQKENELKPNGKMTKATLTTLRKK